MGVIGTAGHVDHGKSTLVRALTGIDPDRLKEEKAREMTIDLGFAWLALPNVAPIGIIDVPGHRDFIENMLAGVGGIDASLFVVAADEGVMPQTREHLAILDLLHIPAGLIALTKIDLAPDSDWIDLVQLELAQALTGTVLENAPVIRLSARTGEGLPALRDHIARLMTHLPAPRDINRPRLWVDRVFSISGHGTVVTGTLLDGSLSVGQIVELQPGNHWARIRGLQTHHQAIERALPGNRVAVNIAGVDRSEVQRGFLLVLPDSVTPTKLAAVQFLPLAEMSHSIKNQAEVKFFCGSAETIARLRILDGDSLQPGAQHWLQLELRDPLPLSKGDRFILRIPSPGETIGGGVVIDPTPGQRWRRNHPEVITHLEVLAKGDPAELLRNALAAPHTLAEVRALIEPLGLSTAEADNLLSSTEGIAAFGGSKWIAQGALNLLLQRLVRLVGDAHQTEPMRPGPKPEKLRSALSSTLNSNPADFETLLDIALGQGMLKRVGTLGFLALPDHEPRWSKTQRAAMDRLAAAFAESPYSPPSVKDAAAIVGEAVLTALIEWGELVQVAPDVVFTAPIWREIAAAARETLEAEGRTTVKSIRDRFNTSRKYALAALEYLNSLGITRRSGDDHVLAAANWQRAGLD